MYDVWQSAAAGAMTVPKTPLYMIDGIKSVLKKDSKYWDAFENGLFSKPFSIPYDEYSKQIDRAISDTKALDIIKRAALPHNWLSMVYHASWHTAWKLDETVRMATYNYLLRSGMTPREAAQTGALFHSDYASVPPATRRHLNRIFFTPTFKIAMAKLYDGMIKGGIKTIFTAGKKSTQQDKILGRGLVYVLGIMLGIGAYMKARGFKQDEWFRKYSKVVETEEGEEKEVVVTFANPFNIPWRYYYRFKGAFTPETTNSAQRLINTVKWDLHPLWRTAYEVAYNQGADFKPVYNPFDDTGRQVLDIAKYSTGQLVGLLRGFVEAERGKMSVESFKSLQKDLGKFQAAILKPFVFSYMRNVEDRRNAGALKMLEKEFRWFIGQTPPEDEALRERMVENFQERIEEILK